MSSQSENTYTYVAPARPKILGLRRSALLEIVLAFALLLALDYFAFDRTRFWDVNPHPFWFVVLFVSCKYGTKEGLLSAVAASMALLFGNMPEQSLAQDSYAYSYAVLKLPMLWLVSSVAFGELRQMHIREREEIEENLMQSQERESRIAQSYQWVRQLKDQFELRVAGQLRSSVAAYQAGKSMERLNPQEVLQGFEDLVSATLHPQQFSIFLLGDKGLNLAVTHGWKDDSGYRRDFNSSDALYQSVVGERQVLCVARSEDERRLGDHGLLAGPLVDRDSGEVVGMLKVEKMAFTDLNLSTIEAFATVGEWAGKALVNARRYQTAKSSSLFNPEINLYTKGYFSRFSDYMHSLAKRMDFPVTQVTARLVDVENLDADTRVRVARALAQAVKSALRNIDLAFDFHENGEEYAILLPATSHAGAQVVLGKIRKELDKILPDISKQANFSFSVQAVYEKRAAA